jgi:hypothetical protein
MQQLKKPTIRCGSGGGRIVSFTDIFVHKAWIVCGGIKSIAWNIAWDLAFIVLNRVLSKALQCSKDREIFRFWNRSTHIMLRDLLIQKWAQKKVTEFRYYTQEHVDLDLNLWNWLKLTNFQAFSDVFLVVEHIRDSFRTNTVKNELFQKNRKNHVLKKVGRGSCHP